MNILDNLGKVLTVPLRTGRTARFKKDYKRESKGQHHSTLDADLTTVLILLVNNTALPERLHDHPLTGSGRTIGIATPSQTWC